MSSWVLLCYRKSCLICYLQQIVIVHIQQHTVSSCLRIVSRYLYHNVLEHPWPPWLRGRAPGRKKRYVAARPLGLAALDPLLRNHMRLYIGTSSGGNRQHVLHESIKKLTGNSCENWTLWQLHRKKTQSCWDQVVPTQGFAQVSMWGDPMTDRIQSTHAKINTGRRKTTKTTVGTKTFWQVRTMGSLSCRGQTHGGIVLGGYDRPKYVNAYEAVSSNWRLGEIGRLSSLQHWTGPKIEGPLLSGRSETTK